MSIEAAFVVANHNPLLSLNQIDELVLLAEGLDLSDASGQEQFLANLEKAEMPIDANRILEFMVNISDVPIGQVIPEIRLSPDCCPARRIHWASEQVKRHHARDGQLADASASEALAVVA